MDAAWSCATVAVHIQKDYYENQAVVIGVVLLVMYAAFMIPQIVVFFSLIFGQYRSINNSCHYIMIIICVLDMVNLSYALGVTGVVTVMENLVCTESVYAMENVINQGLIFWYAYTAATVTLALNRALQIMNKELSKKLFDGYRLIFWLIGMVVYALVLQFSASDPFYFLNYHESNSSIMVLRNGKPVVNPIIYYNNIGKCIFISLNSSIIVAYIRKEAAQSSHPSMSAMERNVSIQVVIMAIITDISVISYVITDWNWNPIQGWIFYGTVIQIAWGLLHGLNAIVYLTLNRSVRNSAKFLLSEAWRRRRYTTTHPSDTTTTNTRSPVVEPARHI